MEIKMHVRPVITADIIVCRRHENRFQVLLVQRSKDPFIDCWALPGGHFEPETDLSIKHCAQRELQEETNIEVDLNDLFFYGYYDAIGRDPRGRYVSFSYYCTYEGIPQIIARDDVKDYRWQTLGDLDNLSLAFDHKQMIKDWIGGVK